MMLELEPGYAYKLSRGRWSLPVIVSAEDAAKSKHIGVTMVDGQKMQVFKVGRSTYAQTFGRKRNAAGGRRASHNHAGTRKPRAEKPADEDAARELELFIENDGRLYEQQWKPILKNLANKKAQGKYDRDKAVKLFMYLMESGAKKYAAEVSGEPASWSRTFDVPTRKLAAKSFVENFEHYYKEGVYNDLLTKVSAKAKAAHPNRAGVRRRRARR